MLGEHVCDGGRVLNVLAGGGDLGDDPPLLSLPGVESPPTQHQIAGAPRTDDPADPRYPARGGQDPDTDLGESENRCGIGDPDVGGECEFEPPPRQ